MWISRMKWKKLEKRVTDLEGKVQGQQEIFKYHMDEHIKSVNELKEIIDSLKDYVVRGNEHTL